MKIFRLNMYLNEDGFKESIQEFECHETKNSFIVNTPSGFGGAITRLKKEEILRVDSKLRPDLYNRIHKYTWYFEEQKEKAKKLVHEHLFNTAKTQANIAAELLRHLTTTINP